MAYIGLLQMYKGSVGCLHSDIVPLTDSQPAVIRYSVITSEQTLNSNSTLSSSLSLNQYLGHLDETPTRSPNRTKGTFFPFSVTTLLQNLDINKPDLSNPCTL